MGQLLDNYSYTQIGRLSCFQKLRQRRCTRYFCKRAANVTLADLLRCLCFFPHNWSGDLSPPGLCDTLASAISVRFTGDTHTLVTENRLKVEGLSWKAVESAPLGWKAQQVGHEVGHGDTSRFANSWIVLSTHGWFCDRRVDRWDK